MNSAAAMPTYDDTGELALPTYAVLARFRESAPTGEQALRAVTARLVEADEPFNDVTLERQEGTTSWMVVARFVLVSVDGHTAVLGLHETLHNADLRPDEVWLDSQLS